MRKCWNGHCKRDLGIDVLIPARKDLEIYKDVVGLAEGGLLAFQPVPAPSPRAPAVPVHRPEKIRKREEARQRTLAQRKAEAAQKTQAVQKVPRPSALRTPSPEQARSEVAAVADLKNVDHLPGAHPCGGQSRDLQRRSPGALGLAGHGSHS
jgi:hypothetical protein